MKISNDEKKTISHKEYLITNEIRWCLTLLASVSYYIYLYVSSKHIKKNGDKESKATSLLLNPKAYGYRKILGDKNSPTLWNPKDPIEILLITIIILIGPIFFFYFKKKNPDDALWLLIIKTLTIWINLTIILILIPINPFHRRILYNFKFMLASMLEKPAKELYIAFLFIVLFPLPGGEKSTVQERILWLFLKLGIFYVLQNFLLGPPHYGMEKPGEEDIIYINKSQYKYYGIIIGTVILLFIFETWLTKKLLQKIKK